MTPRVPTVLLAALAVGVVAAAILLSGDPRPSPQDRPRPTPNAAARSVTRSRTAGSAARDPVLAAARAYALAARNWTAASYPATWRHELRLAADRYRHRLLTARPSTAQLHALRSDAAASHATVTRIRRDPRVRAPRARVLVWLHERTHATGQTVIGSTRNEVRLRRHGRRWLITGWTALPGAETAP